jgi:hypothetical protein
MKLSPRFLAAVAIALSSCAHAQDRCAPLLLADPQERTWITAEHINKPGEYCLTHDIKAPRVYGIFRERSYPEGAMLVIKASDVLFDLRGFTMNVEASGMSGVHQDFEIDNPYQSRITIRNGRIRVRTQSGIMFNVPDGSLMSDFRAIYKSQDIMEQSFQEMNDHLPRAAKDYHRTDFVVERMKVEAATIDDGIACMSCVAIGMKGAANIIRNSTIEITDGHAAMYLFGPNQVIENNLIIFKGKAAVESAAAIKLHQADGTVIRNNDIIIDSTGEDAPRAAISLIDSKNVIAEGNRIYGAKKLVHAWDDKSSLIERNNEFRSILRRPWTAGKPGVR